MFVCGANAKTGESILAAVLACSHVRSSIEIRSSSAFYPEMADDPRSRILLWM